MQICPPEEQENIVHPSILLRGTWHNWTRVPRCLTFKPPITEFRQSNINRDHSAITLTVCMLHRTMRLGGRLYPGWAAQERERYPAGHAPRRHPGAIGARLRL